MTPLIRKPTPGMQITVCHSEGSYGPQSLTCDELVWTEPWTDVAIDGDDALRITGDDWNVRVYWIEGGRVIDDMTGSTPTGAHYDAVVYWLRSLDGNAAINTLLQEAGLFHVNEFIDDAPALAA